MAKAVRTERHGGEASTQILSERERIDPVHFAVHRLRFQPDPVQARVLDPAVRRGILNCTRQWGKSTITAVKALHHALAEPDRRVVLVSGTWNQVSDFLQKVRDFLAELGIAAKSAGVGRKSILLPNGSMILGASGRSRLRGISNVSLMLIDEAAEVAENTYKALRPMMAAVQGGGSLWLMSTPQGRTGFFWETWENGGPRWTRISVPATECPRISAEFLEEEREVLGERWFRQEYLCEFLETKHSLFREDDIEAAVTDGAPPMWQPTTGGGYRT